MKAIIGLGNPGPKYEKTRHNVGFWVIDECARRLGTLVIRSKFQSLVGDGRISGEPVLLVKPQTFMNLSGNAVREVVDFYKLDIEQDIVIVYDDMDFAPGQIKLRLSGRAGGHNGIKSIIQSLGTESFCRIRIGIGRPVSGPDIIDHVLGTFSRDEQQLVERACQTAAEAAISAVERGFLHAMNKYNSTAP
jgi:PTH1 family peptidyl-tRNA hydrolase